MWTVVCALFGLVGTRVQATTNVYLVDVPDYDWYYGCVGTAGGNLMGYWDRHGFPDFYTGPVNGGLSPLNTFGANLGIISMWASKAGFDGRAANMPGHVDDYYVGFGDTGPDPYVTAGRLEHAPDCIGDFVGLSQRKWSNMAGECNGNIDGFCFNYWDTNGNRRVNFTPTSDAGEPVTDVQSGLRAWTQSRGSDCEVFSQLADFNPNKPPGAGFTFADLKAEIDAGYPVLLFLQPYSQKARTLGSATNVNPEIHSMLAYGYYVDTTNRVRFRTSWASGPNALAIWGPQSWVAQWNPEVLPVRGMIGYHPLPKIKSVSVSGQGDLSLRWDGPASDLYDSTLGRTNRVHGYLVEMSLTLSPPAFQRISSVLVTNTYTVSNCPSPAYLRIQLVKP